MELMLEFEAKFSNAIDRDAARRFLNKDGPAFGDEVALLAHRDDAKR
jgi:hypothetical protein